MLTFNGRGFVECAFDGSKYVIGSAPKGPKGTYVCWLPSSRSALDVVGWCKMVGMTDIVAPSDMHMTIIHSDETDTDPADHGDMPLPRQVGLTRFNDPRTMVLGKAGTPGALVVTYDSSDLANRHRYWRDERGVKHSHDHFIPHMTLSYNASAIPPHVLQRLHAHPCPVPIELIKERVAFCNP